IFARRSEIVIIAEAAGGLLVDQLAKALLGLAAGDDDLPGLAVAPGRRALRSGQHVLDGGAIDLLGKEGANGVALVEELFEHADAAFSGVAGVRGFGVHDLTRFRAPDATRHEVMRRRAGAHCGSWVPALRSGTSRRTASETQDLLSTLGRDLVIRHIL